MGTGSAVTEFYTYDDDNRLIGTYKNGLMASGRAYDGAGRMTDYITYTSSGAIDSRRENLYFDNGWMKQQNLYGGGGGLNQRTDYSAANAYDKVGNLLNYNVGVYSGTSYTNYYTYMICSQVSAGAELQTAECASSRAGLRQLKAALMTQTL